MNLDLLRLLFDTGTLVLIWVVQLVIYPAFLYYAEDDLRRWHPKYTVAVTYLVLPLMTGQLICSALQLLAGLDWYTVLSAIIIGSLWAITFARFVPLHNALDRSARDESILQSLMKENWYRTVLWTVLFAISILYIV